MKILLWSNAPWMLTGYGRQTALWAPRLAKAGHEVAIGAFAGLDGAAMTWQGLHVYPGGREAWGMDIMAGHVAHFRPDLVITLMDTWVINPAVLAGLGVPVACWTPVDAHQVGAVDLECLQISGARPVAMSRHGQRALAAAGLDPLYVPHGIDTAVFRPPADREQLRARLGVEGRFVVGMNAANQDKTRKGFSEAFQAFAEFRKRHPAALLMVHTRWDGESASRRDGLNLGPLADACGIRGHVAFSDQYSYAAGLVDDEAMAQFYGALDVYLAPSRAEGFGIPVIEAQACGVPAIVTDCSALSELAGPGWKVGGQREWAWLHEAWWVTPSVRRLAAALEQAHQSAAKRRSRAREFALGYDVESVLSNHWEPVLAELAAGRHTQ